MLIQTCNKYFNMEIYDDKIMMYIKDIPIDNYNKSKLCFEIVDIYMFLIKFIWKLNIKRIFITLVINKIL